MATTSVFQKLEFEDMSYSDDSEDMSSGGARSLRKRLDFDFLDDCEYTDQEGEEEEQPPKAKKLSPVKAANPTFSKEVRRNNLRKKRSQRQSGANGDNNVSTPTSQMGVAAGPSSSTPLLTTPTSCFSPCRTRSGRIYTKDTPNTSAKDTSSTVSKIPTPIFTTKPSQHQDIQPQSSEGLRLNLLQKDLPEKNRRHHHPSGSSSSNNMDVMMDLPSPVETAKAPPPLNYVRRPVSRIRPLQNHPDSPPTNGVQAMKLFDANDSPGNGALITSPVTAPRPAIKSRLFFTKDRRTSAPGGVAGYENASGDSLNKERKRKRANINPFTPTSMLVSLKKKARMSGENKPAAGTNEDNGSFQTEEVPLDDTINGVGELAEGPAKRLRVSDINISRYEEEFVELKEIASGSFGKVKVARHRLDGMVYAIKVTRNQIYGNTHEERVAMNEVFAHSALIKHKHVVRYYNSWVENGRVYLQNEYCEGGSLAAKIREHRQLGLRIAECELKRILLHIAKGLDYIHSKLLVHLDLKPENIFIALEHSISSPNGKNTSSKGEDDEEMAEKEEEVVVKADKPKLATAPVKPVPISCGGLINNVSTDSGHHSGGTNASQIDDRVAFKIGDLGHVAPIHGDHIPEEGDCRYMAPELLDMTVNREMLPKADIFSLGLTLYEAASLRELPKNSLEDPAYERIKSGDLPEVEGYSKDFNTLLRNMVHPDPMVRPSAHRLSNMQCLRGTNSGSTKSRTQLYEELIDTKERLKRLEVELSFSKLELIKERATQRFSSSPEPSTTGKPEKMEHEEEENKAPAVKLAPKKEVVAAAAEAPVQELKIKLTSGKEQQKTPKGQQVKQKSVASSPVKKKSLLRYATPQCHRTKTRLLVGKGCPRSKSTNLIMW